MEEFLFNSYIFCQQYNLVVSLKGPSSKLKSFRHKPDIFILFDELNALFRTPISDLSR